MHRALLLCLLLLAGCAQEDGTPVPETSEPPGPPSPTPSPPSPGAQGELPYTDVEQGVQSGFEDQGLTVRVVGDAQEWEAFWQEHAPGREGPPQVDFADRVVVAAFMGQRSTGGYHIEVTGLRATDGAVAVDTHGREPHEDCGTTNALTHPFHIIQGPRAGVDLDRVHAGQATWETYRCG